MPPRRKPAEVIPGLTPEEMPPLEPVDSDDHDDSGASGDDAAGGQATSP